MRSKYVIAAIFCGFLLLLFPQFPEKSSLTSVFRVTEQPAAIVRGTSGSALTINISFGDVEVEQWIRELKPPYPLLFVDMEWVDRFPGTVRLINEKNIPVSLLGSPGIIYEENTALLASQLARFEKTFGMKPLWFRTADEVFPHSLQVKLWDAEVNALGSTFNYKGGNPPPFKEGEIISIQQSREERIVLSEIEKLYENRTFKPLEDVLFSTTIKTKKLPK